MNHKQYIIAKQTLYLAGKYGQVFGERLALVFEKIDTRKIGKWIGILLIGIVVALLTGIILSDHIEQNWFTIAVSTFALESLATAVYGQLDGTNLESDFEQFAQIAGEGSNELEEHLRRIQSEDRTNQPFTAVANVLRTGIEHHGGFSFSTILEVLENSINAKRYQENIGEKRLKVVRFKDNQIHVNSGEAEEFLKRGLEFTIFVKVARMVDGEATDIERPIGKAEVELVSSQTTELRMVEWNVDREEEDIKELASNNLNNKRVTAQFDVESTIENVEMDALKEAYEILNEVDKNQRVKYD